jgi:hypothetical protein
VRPFTNGTTGPLTITPHAKVSEDVTVVVPAESCNVLPLPQELIALCSVDCEGLPESVVHVAARAWVAQNSRARRRISLRNLRLRYLRGVSAGSHVALAFKADAVDVGDRVVLKIERVAKNKEQFSHRTTR